MKIEFENAGALAYLMGEFANIIRNTEKNSENSVCNMTFGQALEALKEGKKVARAGWNSKGMHLLLIKGKCIHNSITECYGDGIPEHTPEVLDSIAMYTAQKQLVIGWLASQADMLADDWIIIE